MPNVERLRAVLDHIKTLPDAVALNLSDTSNYGEPMWDQHKWIAIPNILTDSNGNPMIEGSCGTAGCFAGWAVMLFTPEFELDLEYGDLAMFHNVIVDGESIPIERLARDLLDLNEFEADALFDYSNKLDDLEAVINKIIAGTYDPES